MEKDTGYADATIPQVAIEPRFRQKRYMFRSECSFDAPDDYYHAMYFGDITIGVTVTIDAPKGWTVWIGRETPLSNRAVFHHEGLMMRGDKVELCWRRPAH